MTTARFHPVRVCRACKHPEQACICDPLRDCPRCRGKGFNCLDDICHGKGYCIHGDTCYYCDGTGVVLPERVLVVPDETAAAIRDYARDNPEIQKSKYRSGHPDEDPITGACYPMAEAYYHATGRDLEIYCLSWGDVDESLTGTHWYLKEPDGEQRWVDLGIPLTLPIDLPPYPEGTHRGFITGDNPSKRCEKILAAIEEGSA